MGLNSPNGEQPSMQPKRTGVLLINLGTPSAANIYSVGRYLVEFLTDGRIIDLPVIFRYLLVGLIIVPFRSLKSLTNYRKIWSSRGSPLYFHSRDLSQKLQKSLGEEFAVDLAMGYQSPRMAETLRNFQRQNINNIIAIPLFPQYAPATWGSTVAKLYQISSKFWDVPHIKVVHPMIEDDLWSDIWAAKISPLLQEHPDAMVIFSFHGLPESHIMKSSTACQLNKDCCEALPLKRCYRAHCWKTARDIAKKLDLAESRMQMTFQSRLGKQEWLKPDTSKVVNDLAQRGSKKIIMVSPAFVADCVETLEELNIQCRQEFMDQGGQQFISVPSLNSDQAWVDYLANVVQHSK
jgi:protoporphyrin/coproporphyrin ferrochelatase